MGLLVTAVFAYFYTVVPIYQKSVLDEEIAKRTLDLQSLSAKVSSYEEQASRARRDLEQMQAQLAEANSQLAAVTQQLASANERATRLYIELRSYVASRAIADMSAACSRPWLPGGESLFFKDSFTNPRTVKVTDNLLAICAGEQLKRDEMTKELRKLSSEDQNLFQETVVAAAREVAPKIEAYLRAIKKRDLENRAKGKDLGMIGPELKEDEIALYSLAFSYIDQKMATRALIYQALTDARTRQDAYAEIVRTALFGALDRFLKARPLR